MKHHDDIGPALERFAIAGLLVPAIAQIPVVQKDSQPDFLRELDRCVAAAIIDEQNLVNEFSWYFVTSSLKGPGSVIAGITTTIFLPFNTRTSEAAQTPQRYDYIGTSFELSKQPASLFVCCGSFEREAKIDRMIVDLVKEFTFEAAHRLPCVPEDHKCARLHGHSFRCEVAVRGEVDPKTGWFIDYAEISEAFEPLRQRLDHYYLNEIEGLDNATSENLARWIWERLEGRLPGLHRVTIRETCSAHCDYFGE